MKIIYILFATFINSVYSMAINNSITLPTNECGYSNIIYNNSLYQFNQDDTVQFYNFDALTNCGPQNTTQGCVHLQHMTGPFSVFGYNPYTIWYYPQIVNDSYSMNLFYNYNGGSTIMVGSVPCDGQLYMLGLTKCAFNQQLFSFQFYKYYLFDFYVQCSYNGTTMALKIDESSDTCVGFDEHQKCIINHNSNTLVNFQDWIPTPFDYNFDTSDFGVYTSSTTEDLPTITVTVNNTITVVGNGTIETVTVSGTVPTETVTVSGIGTIETVTVSGTVPTETVTVSGTVSTVTVIGSGEVVTVTVTESVPTETANDTLIVTPSLML